MKKTSLVIAGLLMTWGLTAHASDVVEENQVSEVAPAEVWTQMDEFDIEEFFGMSEDGAEGMSTLARRPGNRRGGARRGGGVGRRHRPAPPRHRPAPPRRGYPRPYPRPYPPATPGYFYICSAQSGTGVYYQGRGRWASEAQNYAMNACYTYHAYCYSTGCYRSFY